MYNNHITNNQIPKKIHYIWISNPQSKHPEAFNPDLKDISKVIQDHVTCSMKQENLKLPNTGTVANFEKLSVKEYDLFHFVKHTVQLYHDWNINFWVNNEENIPHTVQQVKALGINVRNLKEITSLNNFLDKFNSLTTKTRCSNTFGDYIDYVKSHVLYQEGGILMDLDFWTVHKIPDCALNAGHLGPTDENFFLGFAPQHSVLSKVINSYSMSVDTCAADTIIYQAYTKIYKTYLQNYKDKNENSCNFDLVQKGCYFERDVTLADKINTDASTPSLLCIGTDFHRNSWNDRGKLITTVDGTVYNITDLLLTLGISAIDVLNENNVLETLHAHEIVHLIQETQDATHMTAKEIILYLSDKKLDLYLFNKHHIFTIILQYGLETIEPLSKKWGASLITLDSLMIKVLCTELGINAIEALSKGGVDFTELRSMYIKDICVELGINSIGSLSKAGVKFTTLDERDTIDIIQAHGEKAIQHLAEEGINFSTFTSISIAKIINQDAESDTITALYNQNYDFSKFPARHVRHDALRDQNTNTTKKVNALNNAGFEFSKLFDDWVENGNSLEIPQYIIENFNQETIESFGNAGFKVPTYEKSDLIKICNSLKGDETDSLSAVGLQCPFTIFGFTLF